MLADSPDSFEDSGNIFELGYDRRVRRPPFTMTNKGLRVELFLLPTNNQGQFWAPLNCGISFDHHSKLLLAVVKSKYGDEESLEFRRLRLGTMVRGPDIWGEKRTVCFIKQNDDRQNTTFGTRQIITFGMEKFDDRIWPLLALRTEPLLRNGYTSFREDHQDLYCGVTATHMIQPLVEYGEGRGRKTIMMMGGLNMLFCCSSRLIYLGRFYHDLSTTRMALPS